MLIPEPPCSGRGSRRVQGGRAKGARFKGDFPGRLSCQRYGLCWPCHRAAGALRPVARRGRAGPDHRARRPSCRRRLRSSTPFATRHHPRSESAAGVARKRPPPVRSNRPVKLKLKFECFGGSKIDTDSIKIIYLKNPEVDLTKRVKPFIAEDGKALEMDAARVPPGDHMIKVDLKDSDGRPATVSFLLKVAK